MKTKPSDATHVGEHTGLYYKAGNNGMALIWSGKQWIKSNRLTNKLLGSMDWYTPIKSYRGRDS